MTNFDIKVVSALNTKYISQCEDIAEKHHKDNGGTLSFVSLVRLADYVICAVKNNKVVGYAGVAEDYLAKGDMFILQIAVAPNYIMEGIASSLMEYIKVHSKGRKVIVSGVEEDNYATRHLYDKMGFSIQELSGNELTYTISTRQIENNNNLACTEEEYFYS